MTDTDTFRGKTVLVTGVGRAGQVGEVVARTFAERGARLVLVDRIAEQVEARAADLRASRFEATAKACDLTDPSAVAVLAKTIASEVQGKLYALVNMAGGFAASGRVADSDPEQWHRMIAINLTTAYVATRAFLPMVRAARGSVVYFAADPALPGARAAEIAAYAVAKAGVATLMRSVAQEELTSGVRANAVAPTTIRTATNMESMPKDTQYVEREEVADIVTYLCSPAAAAVTGQLIRLA